MAELPRSAVVRARSAAPRLMQRWRGCRRRRWRNKLAATAVVVVRGATIVGECIHRTDAVNVSHDTGKASPAAWRRCPTAAACRLGLTKSCGARCDAPKHWFER